MNYSAVKVKTWAVSEQPKEKILIKGLWSLSDAELLSILVGWGTEDKNQIDIARLLLSSVNNSLNDLAKLSVVELCKVEGITKPKALQIVTALEIGRRRRLQEVTQRNKIASSKDVFDLFQPILGDLPHEEFWVLYLNRSNMIIEKMKLSQGGISGTVTDVRIVMKRAIEYLASGIIVCHNHPSGNLNPSESDTKITQKIKEAGNLMDIQLLDHIVVTVKDYYSFADSGLL